MVNCLSFCAGMINESSFSVPVFVKGIKRRAHVLQILIYARLTTLN